MINILDMLENEAPKSQSIGAKPIFTGNEKFVDIDNFDRKQKLSYIEWAYATKGKKAIKDIFVKDILFSSRISKKVLDKSIEYGMHKFNKNN